MVVLLLVINRWKRGLKEIGGAVAAPIVYVISPKSLGHICLREAYANVGGIEQNLRWSTASSLVLRSTNQQHRNDTCRPSQ